MAQIDHLVDSMGDVRQLKVFTSGSFLDPMEVSLKARDYFFSKISDKVSTVLIESRTEYITKQNLANISSFGPRIRIAIGLESANDIIIRESINKGSSFAKFSNAASVVNDSGLDLRTYLLFKPPFLSEKKSIEDMLDSISRVRNISTDISINPMNIQKNTMVEYLWKKGLYRLPTLYGLSKILIEGSKSGAQVVSYPTGGNKERGVHNQNPDHELLNLIYSSSLEQDFAKLSNYLEKSDISQYERFLELEDRNLYQPDIIKMISRTSKATFLN
jgi:radical SAM enzyme (TIGR01210 family)